MSFAVSSVSHKPEASKKSRNLELSHLSLLSTEWTVRVLRLNWVTAVLSQGTFAPNQLRVPGLFATKVTPSSEAFPSAFELFGYTFQAFKNPTSIK